MYDLRRDSMSVWMDGLFDACFKKKESIPIFCISLYAWFTSFDFFLKSEKKCRTIGLILKSVRGSFKALKIEKMH